MTQTTLLQAMQYLYSHEINCGLQSFWDADFRVWLGGGPNGEDVATEVCSEDLDTAGPWLIKKAKELYPNCEWKPL